MHVLRTHETSVALNLVTWEGPDKGGALSLWPLNLGPRPPPECPRADTSCPGGLPRSLPRALSRRMLTTLRTQSSARGWSSGGPDLRFGTSRESLSRKLTLLSCCRKEGGAGTRRRDMRLRTEWHRARHRKPPNSRRPPPPTNSLQGRPPARRQRTGDEQPLRDMKSDAGMRNA